MPNPVLLAAVGEEVHCLALARAGRGAGRERDRKFLS